VSSGITSDSVSSAEVGRAPYRTNDIFLTNLSSTRSSTAVLTTALSCPERHQFSLRRLILFLTYLSQYYPHLHAGLPSCLFLLGFHHQNSVCISFIFLKQFFFLLIVLQTYTFPTSASFSAVENPIFLPPEGKLKRCLSQACFSFFFLVGGGGGVGSLPFNFL